MSKQVQLGDEIDHLGAKWRVVRILTGDHSLFEDTTGAFIISESYLQVKSSEGEIDFVTLSTERLQYQGVTSNIKAIDPLLWRKP